jgi:hypothetical protein
MSVGLLLPWWVAKIVAGRVITYLVVAGVFGGGYAAGKRKKK